MTLQINVAPSDHWHIGHSLAHHVRTWGGQVDEVLFSVDTLRSPGRRGAEWDEGRPKLAAALDEMRARHPNVRALDVDYSPRAAALVAEEFFGGRSIPTKDCFGAPFYAYLHGLHHAANRYVLHLDADMLFGGRSPSWVREAITSMAARPEVLVSAPLPGPPTIDGSIPPAIRQRHRRTQRYGSEPIPQQHATLAYGFTHMTTRVFLIDRDRFRSSIGALTRIRLLRRAYPRNLGHPPFFPLETVFSRAMRRHRLIRLNLLGEHPGMWYVHPPPRSAQLEVGLACLVDTVERGAIRADQSGDDQMNALWSERPASITHGPAMHGSEATAEPRQAPPLT